MGRSECQSRDGTQSLTVSAAWDTPSRHRFPAGSVGTGLPTFCRESRRSGSRRLHAGHRLASKPGIRQTHPGT